MFVFMAHKPRQDADTKTYFEWINLFFLVIFVFEAGMKIACMGCKYFADSYNMFDFLIISITCSSMFLRATKIIDLGNQTSILRVFRLGRVLRLINKAQQLRMIFNTFLITLPSLGSIGLLLLLILFIYTILGVELFAPLRRGENVSADANYESFWLSFYLLVRVATGEGWNFIMDDMLRTDQPNWTCKIIKDYDDYK